MDSEQAIAQLKALIEVPGALKIITNEPRPIEAQKALWGGEESAFVPFPLSDPRAFVCHDVTRLEGRNEKGYVAAHTAEGDVCIGSPEALLPRLLEAGRVGA